MNNATTTRAAMLPKMLRLALALLLALALAPVLLAMPQQAYAEDEPAATYTMSSAQGDVGDDVTLYVSMGSSFPFVFASVKFEYDHEALTLLEVTAGSDLTNAGGSCGYTRQGSKGYVSYRTDYESAIPSGEILILKFHINDCVDGSYPVNIIHSLDTCWFYNLDWTQSSVEPNISNGTITVGTPTPAVGAPASGGLDGDGEVTVGDAMAAALAVVSGGAGLSADQLAAADIDGDGKLTMADVVRIVRLAIGL